MKLKVLLLFLFLSIGAVSVMQSPTSTTTTSFPIPGTPCETIDTQAEVDAVRILGMRLSNSAPGKGVATDGGDVGADMDQVVSATWGVESGNKDGSLDLAILKACSNYLGSLNPIPTPTPTPTPTSDCAFHGRVFDSLNNPVPGATIWIVDNSVGWPSTYATSDINGQYTIDAIGASVYRLGANGSPSVYYLTCADSPNSWDFVLPGPSPSPSPSPSPIPSATPTPSPTPQCLKRNPNGKCIKYAM